MPATIGVTSLERIELAGFTVLVHPEARVNEILFRRVRSALLFDLERIAEVVPPAALGVLRESPVVITPATGPRQGFSGRGMCFHESADWLTANGFDAERAGSVEICNMDDFLLWRAEQPMMTLHEFAHAYHWRLGFERPDVAAAFDAARGKGLYQSVEYSLAPEGEHRRAYALTNAKEYFAEVSEALFGRNDYFPHTREQLREYDPAGLELARRLWSLTPEEIAAERKK